MVSKLIFGAVLLLTLVPSLFAQSTSHVFPQVADGSSGPLTYKSAIMVRNGSNSAAVECTLNFHGLRVTLLARRMGLVAGPNTSFPVSFGAPDTWAYLTTTGQQALATGYATLTCNSPVFAQILFSLYNGNTKVGEAAVLSAEENTRALIIADQTEGSHIGLAITNNTDVVHDYQISAADTDANFLGIATVRIGPRSSLSKFLDELLPASANALASATIRAADATSFSAVGLRFTGPVFATIPVTK